MARGDSLPICDVSSPAAAAKSLARLLEHLSPSGTFGHSLNAGLIPPLHLTARVRRGHQAESGPLAVIGRVSLALATRVSELEKSERALYRQCSKANADLEVTSRRADTLNASYQVENEPNDPNNYP